MSSSLKIRAAEQKKHLVSSVERVFYDQSRVDWLQYRKISNKQAGGQAGASRPLLKPGAGSLPGPQATFCQLALFAIAPHLLPVCAQATLFPLKSDLQCSTANCNLAVVNNHCYPICTLVSRCTISNQYNQHNHRSTTLKIEQMELFNKVSFASFCSPQQSDELSFITFQHHLVLFSENTSRTTAPGVI